MTTLTFSHENKSCRVTIEGDDADKFTVRINLLVNMAIGLPNEALETMPGTLLDFMQDHLTAKMINRAVVDAAQTDESWAAFREGILSGKPQTH